MQPKTQKKPRKGARLLRAYVEDLRNEASYRTLAVAVGVSGNTMWQWAHARSVPKLQSHRRLLALATKGAVPEDSWLDREEKAALAKLDAGLGATGTDGAR